MSEMPDDIIRTAKNAVFNGSYQERVYAVAAAILAERIRCADVAIMLSEKENGNARMALLDLAKSIHKGEPT